MSDPTDTGAATDADAGGTREASPTALAPHHLRLFALMVDYLLIGVVINIVQKLLLGAEWDLRPPPPGGLRPTWLVAGALLFLLRDSVAGQSPGKWFMGIAAVAADDPATAPGLLAGVKRNVTLVLLPVEAVLVFVDRYCRRLGDRLAGTVVVSRPKPAPVSRRLLGMAIIFMATTLAIFLAEYWNVRRSAAYPVAVRVAQAEPVVQETFGDGLEFMAPGLQRSLDGRDVLVTLGVEGDRGEGTLTVRLRREDDPPRWSPQDVQIQRAPESETPPAGAPTQQDAPPR